MSIRPAEMSPRRSTPRSFWDAWQLLYSESHLHPARDGRVAPEPQPLEAFANVDVRVSSA